MPEDRVRDSIVGAPLDFALIRHLTEEFLVSKYAAKKPHADLTRVSSCELRGNQGGRLEQRQRVNAADERHA
jgi:hypothetical protein